MSMFLHCSTFSFPRYTIMQIHGHSSGEVKQHQNQFWSLPLTSCVKLLNHFTCLGTTHPSCNNLASTTSELWAPGSWKLHPVHCDLQGRQKKRGALHDAQWVLSEFMYAECLGTRHFTDWWLCSWQLHNRVSIFCFTDEETGDLLWLNNFFKGCTNMCWST